MDNNTTSETDVEFGSGSLTADSLNYNEVRRLAPLILYLSVIAAAGLPGNLVVCIIYRRWSTLSNSKLFIFWLAVIDFINCITLSLEIVSVVQQYNYSNAPLCKFSIFITSVLTLTSGSTLVVISIDRYRKVCQPLKWQISYKAARVLCGATVLVSLLFSWPFLIFVGLREEVITPYNIVGTGCGFQNKYDGNIYMTIYSAILWMLFLITFSIIAIFYCIIGKQIFHQMSRHSTSISHSKSDNDFSDVVAGVPEESTSCGVDSARMSRPSPKSKALTLGQRSMSLLSTVSTSTQLRAHRQRLINAKRSAYIMFLISLVFIISFLPYLSLRLQQAIDKDFVSSMSDTSRAMFKFFLRTYFLNCAVNPFIYCACASQFRKDVKNLFKRMLRR